MDWFLYDRRLRHERVKELSGLLSELTVNREVVILEQKLFAAIVWFFSLDFINLLGTNTFTTTWQSFKSNYVMWRGEPNFQISTFFKRYNESTTD